MRPTWPWKCSTVACLGKRYTNYNFILGILTLRLRDITYNMIQVMEVATWDGRTKYKMEESKEEEAKRLEEWENYLKEGGDDKKPLEAP